MSNKISVSSEFCLTFIRNARLRRTSQLDLLREENLALLNIINDFDARLAQVEAERDELQRKLNGYNHTAKMCGIHMSSIAKRVII